MRLLHVVPSYFPAVRYGGPIYSVHGLCAALAARGHDVHVFTTNVDGTGDSPVPLGRPTLLDGVKVWYFPSRRMRRIYWAPSMARALHEQIASFDLGHLHSVFLWPTWAAARAARSAGIPYVLSPRGMLVGDLLRERSRHVKAIWMTVIERANLARAAAIHTTSSIETRELEKLGYRLGGRIVEIPNGVAVVDQSRTEPDPGAPYVLMLGRINWKKRIEIAIDALKLVDGVRLVIAGGDDEGVVPALSKRADGLGIRDRVEFVGLVEGAQKKRLLQGALVLLMPSLSENFGNVVLEAMAVGTPAVVTPQVGAADVVTASGAGFVAAPTADAFADAIRQVQSDQELRLRLGRQARSFVREHYAWPIIAARMEDAYRSILADRRDGERA